MEIHCCSESRNERKASQGFLEPISGDRLLAFCGYHRTKKVTPEYISSFIQHTAQVRNLDPATLAGYEKMMNGDLVTGPRAAAIRPWAERQCYLAFGNIMNAAAAMHIDTCPLEGLDPAAYDELLNLKDSNYATIAAVAVGYRHTDDKYAQLKKVRFESNQVISWIK